MDMQTPAARPPAELKQSVVYWRISVQSEAMLMRGIRASCRLGTQMDQKPYRFHREVSLDRTSKREWVDRVPIEPEQ